VATSALRLHHELLLLALHDEKGTLAFGQMIEYGLGGALLTELMLEERVKVVEENRWRLRQFVEMVRDSSTGDAALDAAMEKITTKRRTSPVNTIGRLASIRGLRNLVATDLARRGILQETQRQVLLLFRRRVYPTLDPQPERAVVARVRQAMDGGKLDARTAALIGLANATGSLSAIYKRAELRALKPRIKAIQDSDLGSRAVRDAVSAAHAATMAAVAAAVAASSASGAST
jgi:Golgi phosphoprotein 3